MSDEGERTCPLCAEEMDLTDQQLKPCKCGYEICVWCWHHIMDMAEKDETEGRCPACRTPYDKEKIVGMTANCKRLVAEMSMERKQKSQKTKGKTSEQRKQLGSVRVIQRNLVYIVGLPLNLADEDLLQRKEYFGQYGRVLKVSISRTTAGTIQHFANNTCSVYITYSKEEEAVRCIQSVHGFVLEGRSLRACFGTTKYCHAWLRNVPCSNPDCLYLHEIGSQDDSFTKDEIVSAYTRSRVQQITGATNNLQRRSGNVLPPPADEYCNNSSISLGKPISKSATNNPSSDIRISPPNSSSGRSTALPAAAAWGTRASNSQASTSILACPNGPSKQKPDTCNASLPFSAAVTTSSQVSTLHADVEKKPSSNDGHATQQKVKLEPLEFGKPYTSSDHWTTCEGPITSGLPVSSVLDNQSCCPPESRNKDRCVSSPSHTTNVLGLSGQSDYPSAKDDLHIVPAEKIEDLCSHISSVDLDKHRCLQRDAGLFREPLTSCAAGNAVTSTKDISVANEQSNLDSDLRMQVLQIATPRMEEDSISLDDERLKDPEVVTTNHLPNSFNSFNSSNHWSGDDPWHNEVYGFFSGSRDPQILNNVVDNGSVSHVSIIPRLSNGYPENPHRDSADLDSFIEPSYLLRKGGRSMHVGRSESEAINVNHNNGLDMRESRIISNILSMDFDSLDEPLTSPKNLARFFGDTDKQHTSLSSSRKGQNCSQSRFSFAREEESAHQLHDLEPSLSFAGKPLNNHPLNHSFVDDGDMYFDEFENCNGLSSVKAAESVNASSYAHIPSNKLSVSRSQISAPPGFSVPTRAPPPGFTSHERSGLPFDYMSGNQMAVTSSLLRDPSQSPKPESMSSTGDIEFMDPAILAVGKGRFPVGLSNTGLDMRSNFSPQFNSSKNEAELQLLMQRSLSAPQNQRFSEMGDAFSTFSDAYGIPSRIMDQSLANNISPFLQLNSQCSNGLMSNGRWDGWNEIQSRNDLGMREVLRTERLGFNKLYTGYEESMLRLPSSGDLYNRTFGI